MPEPVIGKIAYDVVQMRPGCVLVAAGLGADAALSSRFDPHDWLLVPTADMGVYEITEDQLRQLIEKTEGRNNLTNG